MKKSHLLLLSFCLFLRMCHGAEKIKLDGDIVIGGLFPMHEKGTAGTMCGPIKKEKGIQRLEAMLYAVEKINADRKHLLPNITLGLHVLDTCSRDTYALEQSMDFIKGHMSTIDLADYQCDNGEAPTYLPSKPVVGVIGASNSVVSIMVANVLRLFKIPQISYASTSAELSDKTRYEYFSRVVPPDTYQAQAMVDVVKAMKWSYVSTLADEGNYGERGIGKFEERAKAEGLCIAESVTIPREATNKTFDDVLATLLEKERAKVVVMFVGEENCKWMLRAVQRNNKTDQLYFVASDAWGAKSYPIVKQEVAAESTITLLPKREVLAGFDEYFKGLSPSHAKVNPWFEEFWENHFKCNLPDKKPKSLFKHDCKEELTLDNGKHHQEGAVQFVVDAVYAMAHAIHNYFENVCYEDKSCLIASPPMGPTLLEYIRNVTFKGHSGNVVKFNSDGDVIGLYDIYQYQMIGYDRNGQKNYGYVPVGTWSNAYGDSLTLHAERLKWRTEKYMGRPISRCSDPCPAGFRKSAKNVCCWICVKCQPFEVVFDEHICKSCENGSRPNWNRTECVTLPIMYMSWDSAWAVVPVAVSCFGILCILLVIIVFAKYNRTPIIMASGRELCYVLLLGLFMCFCMTFIMIAKPTTFTCTLLRIGTGLSLSISYAALFTKTNRLSRIFNRGIKAMVKRPSYTSPKSQLIICACLISVQMIGDITWLGMDLPGTVLVYPDRESVVLKCKVDNVAIVISLFYNMILIILCTAFAFKTRNIPENFNEAKYIAFTMYSTCIVWLAFVPIYFGTNNTFQIQTTALCMCISISATVALWCMFAPKIYIVVFQPHKNVRQANSTSIKTSIAKNGSRRPFFSKSRSCDYDTSSVMNGDVQSPSGTVLVMSTSQPQGADTATSDVDSGSNTRNPEESAFLKNTDKFTDTSSGAEFSDPDAEIRESTL
ncbi:metabotropic glutamate receptor 8-like isoform X2 [Lineus longissimus]|uniref:metabotropic glutamate receptor 8-like isoform X2 n=1 Tax=Lineus longissimus TaxID=88925 RepID=UPI00315DF50C